MCLQVGLWSLESGSRQVAVWSSSTPPLSTGSPSQVVKTALSLFLLTNHDFPALCSLYKCVWPWSPDWRDRLPAQVENFPSLQMIL